MRTSLLLAVLALSATTGCAMTNDEIVHQVEYCHSKGFDTRYLRDAAGRTWTVECVEKGKP